jgi:hypothetical protein
MAIGMLDRRLVEEGDEIGHPDRGTGAEINICGWHEAPDRGRIPELYIGGLPRKGDRQGIADRLQEAATALRLRRSPDADNLYRGAWGL